VSGEVELDDAVRRQRVEMGSGSKPWLKALT